MIEKPKNWDEMEETEVGSSGLPKGIYPVKIVAVKDIAEKQYLEIKFDVIKGDYTGYFLKASGGDYSRWYNQGIYRCSYKESATVFFKRFITAVQKSNKNYVWDWNEISLIGKFFVAVMDEEEYLDSNNELKVTVRLQSVRSLDALMKGDIKLPGLKKLRQAPAQPAAVSKPVEPQLMGDLPF